MRVVVVGSGISGLTCAHLLLAAGHDVTLVTGDALSRTTSYLAAAVWFPTEAGPAAQVARWGATTYGVLAAQAAAAVPGVVMRESMALYRDGPDTPAELPAWSDAVGDIRPARANELPHGYPRGLRFVVPLVHMPVHLPYLADRVKRAGARTVTRHLDGLDDVLHLGPDVVVNAAGMAAGALAGDDSMYPVRGQIVRVANPGLALSVRDEDHPGGRAYVHPRTDDCILGGTLERDSWSTVPDPAQTAAILERCADLAPALAAAHVIESVAGLRPGRSAVRLEIDDSLLPVPVVHDYGHGGAGITLGAGCAADVVDLVAQVAGR